jgi:uncharacterized membrane protein
MLRTVASTTDRFGPEMCPGDKIIYAVASANRDEDIFDNPDDFRLERPNGREHLAFGDGPHICPGQAIARLEARITLEVFVERVATAAPAPGWTYRKVPIFWANGPIDLHARLIALPASAHRLVSAAGWRQRGHLRRVTSRRAPMTSADLFLVFSVLLATAVEMVEATTVVLAVGTTRGWRGAGYGAIAGLGMLGVVIGALGPAISRVPLGALRTVVGGLLLTFGLGWLRKAILRASGWKARHDEAAIFAEEKEEATRKAVLAGAFDSYGFTLCLKAVLLEGLEVAFIVLTFGSNANNIALAGLGAALAVVAVACAAVAVRAPLARVPENTMKFAVGLMLVTFGTFWGAEGTGVHWPGADAFLPVLLGIYTGASLCLITALRRLPHPPTRPALDAA